MGKKVIVGISGGVDSSVSALLLKQQGYDVQALFMKNWDEKNEAGCIWETDAEDALQVCDSLDIPLNTVDLSREYWHEVFTNFLAEYKSGRTPNPDILCNQEIKFKAFLEHALKLGAELIATGHYARIENHDGSMLLKKGLDSSKDQSYFLCRLNQGQLKRSLFPLGDIKKNRVREIAAQHDLVTHAKKDSTGICFIGERPFRDFLSQYIPVKKGEIQTLQGEQVGEHDGVFFYTLGQRQGLGIGGKKNANEQPWYVVDKNVEDNLLIVAQGHDNPALYSSAMQVSGVHWISNGEHSTPLECSVKTRYRQTDQKCQILEIENETVKVTFAEAQRAVTPGQYAVFYKDDVCLGGGVIESTA